jgi:Domain of unknown function (DUF4160)
VPTVSRFNGLRVAIYLNDHRPAHVHVIGGGNSAVFDLHCPHGPPTIRERYGFKASEVRRIEAKVAAELATLCRRWEEIHGHP